MTTPRRQWKLREQAPAECSGAFAALHPAVARLLAARGWTASDPGLAEFLAPKLSSIRDPLELGGVEAAVERIAAALSAREPLAVYGDYDADGLCATAVMVRALRYLGAEPHYVVPHRIDDGYGLSARRVRMLAAEGVKLLVTVDTGITAVEEVELARSLGMDVVVTDHHLAGDSLPQALVVNPNLEGAAYAGGRLCGAGVAFKVAHALVRRMRPGSAEARAFTRGLLDFVALATVADVVPLLEENRVLVRHGLRELADSAHPGIRALLAVGGQRPDSAGAISPDAVGFGMAPRLNAAGRTEGDPAAALELLLTDDPVRAEALAKRLDEMNKQRRALEAAILREAIAQLDAYPGEGPSAFVLAAVGWHLGVVGTVAARVCERVNRPAVVLATDGNGMAKGSARSIRGYDIHGGLLECAEHLLAFGGHAAAAGLRLHADKLGVFRDALDGHARAHLLGAELSPQVDVDTKLEGAEIDWGLHEGVQSLQPFGEGNPAPVFLVEGVEALPGARVVGTNHLRLRLRAGGREFTAIAFSLAGHHEAWSRPGSRHDILCRTQENNFRGARSLELEVLDSRAVC
ncbi:MAG: single-stranded-DNA-specific exonuclease RecJ [Candidatus Sumerlaeia bacterium]|nr:single-stranded-DNA-specific exonuclease RecJ [Candidatus Sumerlaeia bacterium]